MKKIKRTKITLDRSTIRSLSEQRMLVPNGGELPQVSVGTCTGCKFTYCATDVTCMYPCVEA